MKFKDLTGMKFDLLTAIKRAPDGSSGQTMWVCDCDCGVKGVVVRRDTLMLKGPHHTCGCRRGDGDRVMDRGKMYRPNTFCDKCGKPIHRSKTRLLKNKRKFCSYFCLFGKNRVTSINGRRYRKKIRMVSAPEWAYPMAYPNHMIAEHRLVMSKTAGRLLYRGEVVHHRDHDPSNNSPDNLELWPSNASHIRAEHGVITEGADCSLK